MPAATAVVLLAAGRGVRMKSARPKVLHEAAGRALVDHVVAAARTFLAGRPGSRLVVVAGAGRDELVPHLARTAPEALVAVQDPPRGTGDAVRVALTAIKGIGPWTADIYLLMVLRRPDAWPSADLALAVAVQQIKGLAARPGPQELEMLGWAWRPWRAVAARLLWHHYLSGAAPI